MIKMIRKCVLVMCITMLVLGNTVYAEAATDTTIVQPYYTYILAVTNELEISGSKALIDAKVTSQKKSDLSIEIKLQKKSGTTWTTIKTWSANKDGAFSLTISKEQTISNGTYRLYSTFCAGNETKIDISETWTK